FDRQPLASLDDAVELYGPDEFASPTRSTVPLLSFLERGDGAWRSLLGQIGAANCDTEAHLEFTVKPKQGRGKASHTDVMLIYEGRAVAIEAKWTEPRYDEISAWLNRGSDAQNRRDVMNGWLSLLQLHAAKKC